MFFISFLFLFSLPDGVDWEDCGYDEKHRDFFRLLRQRKIDVFAVYERMRFSEYFLRCLYQRHVLSCPEYDELLSSLETKRVHLALNKELIDVINLKPRQLQELFVDQLLHHEAHLFSTLTGQSCYSLLNVLMS